MKKWYEIFPKNTGISIYIWLIFCTLPFYFLFKSTPTLDFLVSTLVIILFFATYRVKFISQSWFIYVWMSIAILINAFMTLYYGYIYFGLFLSFFIGNIKHKGGFLSIYIVHLVIAISVINIGFFLNTELFVSQILFIIISIVGISLIPFNIYNRNKQEELETLLKNSKRKLAINEERQRIARDLHDTLGQKLSLIGMKTDLAIKLIHKDLSAAEKEMEDVQKTARLTLNEVRELVTNMRSIKLTEEVIKTKEVLNTANIKFKFKGNPDEIKTTLLIENVLSMCLREAVTNIIKHSQATRCKITMTQDINNTEVTVSDDGIGFNYVNELNPKSFGIQGMKERLDFVNGKLTYKNKKGTKLVITVPRVIKQTEEV